MTPEKCIYIYQNMLDASDSKHYISYAQLALPIFLKGATMTWKAAIAAMHGPHSLVLVGDQVRFCPIR